MRALVQSISGPVLVFVYAKALILGNAFLLSHYLTPSSPLLSLSPLLQAHTSTSLNKVIELLEGEGKRWSIAHRGTIVPSKDEGSLIMISARLVRNLFPIRPVVPSPNP